jgi:5-methylcytosine-specific restriction endonuclease McrA
VNYPRTDQQTRCITCDETKPAESFYSNPAKRNGLGSSCRSCVSETYKTRWREKPSEERAAHCAQSRVWEKRNSQRVRASKESNAERNAVCYMRRNARRRGAAHADAVSPLVVLELHDGACGVCGEDVDPFDFQIDHIVPLYRGGLHTYENCQPAHAVCNLEKGVSNG